MKSVDASSAGVFILDFGQMWTASSNWPWVLKSILWHLGCDTLRDIINVLTKLTVIYL